MKSTDDNKAINNVMRHEYGPLTDTEMAKIQAVKDKGLEMFDLVKNLGTSRELSIAQEKIEEAVMWAVKDITR